MDSLSGFPRNAVHPDTEARLTSEIETRSGEPRPFDRPKVNLGGRFINFSQQNTIILPQMFKKEII